MSSTNYRKLAGMASKNKAASKKSGTPVWSKKSEETDRDKELEDIDKKLELLDDKIDNNPAYVAETYEKVQREYGAEFETEADIGENISLEDIRKLCKLQDKVMGDMDRRLKQLQE